MLDEAALRRQDFLSGSPILLADDQWWTFPAPPGRITSRASAPGVPAGFDPDYAATVTAVREAEDEVERLRAELALAICLLDRNYDLPPGALFDLLCYAPGDPALAVVQQAFRRVALEHVSQARPPANAVAVPEVPGRTDPTAAKSEPRRRQRHRPEPALVSASR